MSRILLIHWNAEEAKERAARVRAAGYRVEPYSSQGGEGLRELRERPPLAVLIDLTRLPSHGRAVGVFLRQQKATRHVPLVFIDGDPEKVARVRELLPDASYASWPRFRSALRRAIASPPRQPAVPDTMAGYTGTALPKKLRIRAGHRVALLGAPEGFEPQLGELPEGVHLQRHQRGDPQVVMLFVKSRSDLERRFPRTARALADGGALWIAWPKKTSRAATDLSEAVVRASGLRAGLVDYKICAIDATWSGLCFARRRPAR